MSVELNGGCLCGAVRYRTSEEVVEPAICHCIPCRRASGSPMVGWFGVTPDALEVTGSLADYRSSEYGVRRFCPTCGTQLLFEDSRTPEGIDVSMGSLDDPEAVAPLKHIWVSRQIDWVKLDDGLPREPRDRLS